MIRNTRRFSWLMPLAWAFFTLTATNAARAGILSDNLSSPSGGTEVVTGDTWLAASFGTGSTAADLESISLLLSRSSISGSVVLDLYSDGDFEPGSLQGSLDLASTISTDLAAVTFSASGISLLADTTYWVVLRAESGEFQWSWANDNEGTGAGFQGIWSQSETAGADWFTIENYPLQMRVTTASVPEPASVVMLGLGVVGTAVIHRQGRRLRADSRARRLS